MRNRHGYPRIAEAFYSTPLAILPAKLAEIRAFLELKFQGGEVSAEDVQRVVEARRPGADVQMAGRVAVVPCIGVISQRGMGGNISEQMVSCEEIGAALDALAADKTCKAICMLFDSPGGSVYGVAELANKINAIKAEKKIVGMVDSVAASAAYWLASQCSELNVTPGGQVGSIGVLAAHEDHSKEADEAGVKTTLVTSSKYKGEGSPYAPLDDEAKAEIQSKVDAYHAMFIGAVARGRNVTEARVSKDFGQGRMTMAKEAVAAGMADRVATFAQVLNRMGAGDPGAGAEAPGVPLSARLAAVRARAVELESDGANWNSEKK